MIDARRYVAWLQRRRISMLVSWLLLAVGSAILIVFALPIRADFAQLLPDDAASVRDLRVLERRVSSQDSVLVLIKAKDPVARARVANELIAVARVMPKDLVDRVEADDAITREFLWRHRHLLVPLPDLVKLRDALDRRVAKEKLKRNPLYIDLDDDTTAKQSFDELQARRKAAEAELRRSAYVSSDGIYQLVVLRTAFAKTNIARGKELIARLAGAREAALEINPGVEIGIAAGVASAVVEHDALVRGMLLSSIVTAVLVALVLAAYFRSLRLVILLGVALVLATMVAFGIAALTVGHLNAATAFLGAIIAGNGVNYGILLTARYLEERRHRDPADAIAVAIEATLRPTLVASLAASIAYGSLAATSFRGFADFAVIGGAGMLVCWIASYALLPTLILTFDARVPVQTTDRALGRVLARWLGFRHAGRVCAISGALAIVSGVVAYRFVADDPYEYDMTKLRSNGAAAVELRDWVSLSDKVFGAGISGQTFIAADRPEQVPMIVDALRAVNEQSTNGRTIGRIRSILDVVPEHQPAKLAVLAEIRRILDEAIPDGAEIAALRPPDDLTEITPARLPLELADKLRERDGRIGLLIGVRPDSHLDAWNGRDLIRFTHAVRRLALPDGEVVTTSGTHVIYADIVTTIRDDAVQVIVIAVIGLIVMVLLVVGRNVQAGAVLAATALGAVGLVATCAVLEIRVTFLDFVALPITLGLGVDYAINLAHRHHRDEDATLTLRTSGAAVFVCSLTTIIGYGSLLVSENQAIKGFGLASLIGEICCVITALVVVPAIVGVRRRGLYSDTSTNARD